MFPDVDHHDSSPSYEAKFASLISRTAENLPADDITTWQEAVETLEAEGTYLSLLLISSRHVVDWRRVRRIVFYAVLVTAAVVYASRWIN